MANHNKIPLHPGKERWTHNTTQHTLHRWSMDVGDALRRTDVVHASQQAQAVSRLGALALPQNKVSAAALPVPAFSHPVSLRYLSSLPTLPTPPNSTQLHPTPTQHRQNHDEALVALCKSLGHGSPTVCSGASEQIVRLALQNNLPFNRAVDTFVSVIPSLKGPNAGVALSGLVTLLKAQAQAQASAASDAYVCPYSLVSAPHPLVTVIVNRPDIWPSLLHEVELLLVFGDEALALCTFRLFRPLFTHILAHPQSLRDGCLVCLLLCSLAF